MCYDCVVQMAAALKHVHELGIAHLDVKPDNIFKSISGGSTYKLGDFGNACPKDGSRQWTEGDSRSVGCRCFLLWLKCSQLIRKQSRFASGLWKCNEWTFMSHPWRNIIDL